ncbi:MAG TPA: hypothetical protein VN695_10405 [Streptosporangiaceae bacterium]|nr:hypothetical protein [Streptosporangiaceae bacterium]
MNPHTSTAAWRIVATAVVTCAAAVAPTAALASTGSYARLAGPYRVAAPQHVAVPHRLAAPHRLVGPHHMWPRGGHKAPLAGIPLLNHGGPVQNAPRVYVVYWDWVGDASGEQPYLNQFLSSVGSTFWLSAVSQYGGGSGRNLLAGTWSDPTPIPANPTDAQIQAEAVAAANHFGTGNSVNVQIVVATPTGHSTAGFGTVFCAYHGALAADPNVTYTDLPYMTDAAAACGENAVNVGAKGTLDGVSIVEGHELAETITDPLLNAWFDANGNEIGDKCAWVGLANLNTWSRAFAVQPLWSNNANGCVLQAATTLNIPVGASPYGIAADPVMHTVYVTNSAANTVSVINDAVNPPAVGAVIAVGNTPQGLAVDPNTHTVWVTNNADGTVSVISEATGKVIQTVNVDVNGKNMFPNSVVVDAPTNTVYVGLYLGAVAAVNDGNYAEQTIYNTNGTSHIGVADVNPATHTLYATAADDQSIREINTTTNAVTANLTGIGLPATAALETSAPGYLFVDSFNIKGAVVYNNTNTTSGVIWNVIHTAPGDTVNSLAVNGGNDTLYTVLAPAAGAGSVDIIDAASSLNPIFVANNVPVQNSPRAITIDSGNGLVFVINSASNSVTAMDG